MFLVSPNFGYCHLLMNAKDFVAFSEIVERSKLVDSRYLDDKSYWIDKSDTRSLLGAEMMHRQVITQAQFDELKAISDANKEEVKSDE